MSFAADATPGFGGDDSVLDAAAVPRGENGSDGGSPSESEPHVFGQFATLAVFVCAGGFILYRLRRDPSSTEALAKEAEAAQAAAAAVAATAKSHRRDRAATLRTQRIHLHQFQYAWGAQAHLRMANADFDEHNVRHMAATNGLDFPVLVCGQHVVPAPSIPRVLAEAFPLAAAASGGGGDDDDDAASQQRRLSMLSLHVAELHRLLRYKLWHAGSSVSAGLRQKLLSAVPFLRARVQQLFFLERMRLAHAPDSTLAAGARLGHSAGRGDVDFAGGESECIARMRQGLALLSAELGPTARFLGGALPAPVDAQLFGLLMELEETDPDLYRRLLFPPPPPAAAGGGAGANKFKNLVALQQRVFKRCFEPSAGDQKFQPKFTANYFLAGREWNARRPVVFRRDDDAPWTPGTSSGGSGGGGAAPSARLRQVEAGGSGGGAARAPFEEDDDDDDGASTGAWGPSPAQTASPEALEREARQWRETQRWLAGVGAVAAAFALYGPVRRFLQPR